MYMYSLLDYSMYFKITEYSTSNVDACWFSCDNFSKTVQVKYVKLSLT